MANSQANRWGGLAAMISGLLILLWVISDVMGYDIFVALVPAAVLLLFLSFPAMQHAQGGRNGAIGRVGYWILIVSGGLFTLLFLVAMFIDLVMGDDPEEVLPFFDGPLIAVIFFGLLLGLIIFGISTIAAGIIPRLAVLPFLLGLPLGILLDFVILDMGEDESGPGFFIGIPLFAIGLLWIGWWIWSGKGAGSLSSGVNAE